MIISIEGNIGSGKSTFIDLLKKHYEDNDNVIFINEPIDVWNTIKDNECNTILQKFYNDPYKYAFSFQFMVFISFIEILKKTIENNPNAIIITERSIETNKNIFAKMLYDGGFIEDINYKIYLKWFNFFAGDYSVDKIIYIRSNHEVCLDRVKQRARDGEELIKIDYLETCDKYHEEFIAGKEKYLVLNGNLDLQDMAGMVDMVANFITTDI
jgi:deoxyadenosine/deoxycytidine kinase